MARKKNISKFYFFSKSSKQLFLAAVGVVLPALPALSQEIGSRVMCAPIPSEDRWFAGTVLKKERDSVVVRLDLRADHIDGEVYNIQLARIKPGSGKRPASWATMPDRTRMSYGIPAASELEKLVAGDGLTASAGTTSGSTVNSGGTAYEGAGGATNQMGNARSSQTNASSNQVAGKGSPPNGLYKCNKISGSSYIYIGSVEIKGNTYRGFASEGAFHPYAVDGSGGITWTAGLAGLPDGWRLQKANYEGLDYAGRPCIKIHYVSPRDAYEVVDAIRE